MIARMLPRRTFLASASLLPAAGAVKAAPAAGSPNTVDPRQFGAKCDGRTDDSVSVQRAIDACLAHSPPAILSLTGLAAIATPLIIDRKVDASVGRFRIAGNSGDSGLLALKPMTLVETVVGASLYPSSEFLSFERIRFVASRDGGAAALSSRFLRVQFVDCEFDAVRGCEGATYLQEWTLTRNLARHWRGSFVQAAGAFALRSLGNKFQYGGAVYDLADQSGQYGCIGCTFDSDIMESCSGHYLGAEQTRAVNVRALYFEGNAGEAVVLNQKFPGSTVSVDGCFFQPQKQRADDPDLYSVRWGKTSVGTFRGNWSGGALGLGGEAIASEGNVIDRESWRTRAGD